MTRFLEVDALRGTAVLFMVIYHFAFDWNFFVSAIPGFYAGFWVYFARATAAAFVALAGLSTTLYANRKRESGSEWKPVLKRGAFIFLLGMAITFFTFLAFPAYAIFFGVLHLMGLSIVLGIPFLRRPRVAALAGILIAGIGILFYQPGMQGVLPFVPVLLPGGVQSFDYVPLLPWFGVFLLGMALGNYFYPNGNPIKGLGWEQGNVWVQLLARVGRKSLAIYLVHQPVLVGVLLAGGFAEWNALAP